MKPLLNHTSEQTAYLVDDYPYGFRLRCKIRYWLEYNEKKGFRFCSQTTNPKVTPERWNKPKKSTYALIAGFMFLDDNNHVHWTSLSEYSDSKESQTFLDKNLDFLSDIAEERLKAWIVAKKRIEAHFLAHPITVKMHAI